MMKPAHPRAAAARFPILAVPTLSCLALLTLACLTLLAFVSVAGAASGDLAWQRVYNGTGNGDDRFLDAVPAPNGGVYVAGQTATANGLDASVARYSAAGRRGWLHTYSVVGQDSDFLSAATDRNGDLVVVGSTGGANMTTVRYGPGGRRKWVRIYDDPTSSQEAATQVALDAHGNVYVAGFRYVADTGATGYSIVVIKYSASGARKWLRRYARPGSNDDRPNDVAIDAAGNVYITGHSRGTGGYFDVVTLKFDPSGHRRWARIWDGPAGGHDSGEAIAVSATGTVYVAGMAAGISTADDGVVLKYSTGGALRWSRFKTSAGASTDGFTDIALVGNGDVVAAGSADGGLANRNDVLVARFSPAGSSRWTRTYNGPDSQDDVGYRVAVGSSGAVYVNGYSYGATTASDILTLKYGAAGGFRWARRYTSTGGGSNDAPGALVATAAGVYVTGGTYVAAWDAVLVKYKP